MRRVVLFCAGLALLTVAAPARATVAIDIDLTHQKMHVTASSSSYDWSISSARSGFYTPGGSFAPTHLEAMHYSHKYHMSPMPHSIFFRGGYAIHGTYATGSLGRPASHGCIRLSPGNAALLYGMVKAEGARISISGSPPQGAPAYARVKRRHTPVESDMAAYTGQASTFQASVDQASVDPAPTERPSRRALRRSSESAYYGYRYMGRVQGHKVYQATQPAGYAQGSIFGPGGDFLN